MRSSLEDARSSPRCSSDLGRTGILWALAVATIALLGVPLAFLLFSSFRGPPEFLPIEAGSRWTLDNYSYIYSDSILYSEIIPNTVVYAIGSIAISCGVALFLAMRIERSEFGPKVAARMIVLAPMALPTPALAVVWMQLLGPNAGWINVGLRWLANSELQVGPLNVFSMPGIIWCQGLAGIPVAYLLLAPVVRGMRPELEEASYVSGASRHVTFLRISFPMILSAVAGPVLVLLVLTLEQVDFPYILGPTAGINVLGTRILWELSTPSGLPNIGAASAAAMLILVLAFSGLYLLDKIPKRLPRDHGSAAAGPVVREAQSWWPSATTWLGLLIYTLVTFAAPLTTLLLQGFGTAPSGDPQCCWETILHYSTENRFARAAANTLLVAAVSAALGTAIGVGISLCSARSDDRVASMLSGLSVSSIAIPSLVAAFGVAVVFISFPVGIYGTIGMLMVAYSYRIAMATRIAKSGLTLVGSALEEAAAVSGASWLRTQRNIVLPLLRPSVVSAGALLFVSGVREFTIPLALYSPDNVVLSVMLLQLQQSGHTASAAVVGLVMTAITLLGVACLVLADGRLSRRGIAG